jgi:DNA modification methylase
MRHTMSGPKATTSLLEEPLMEQNQVLNQDSLAYLAAMPDASIDAVITDPPYPNGSGLFMDQLIDGIAGLYLAAKKAKKHVIFFWTPVIPPPSPPPGWFHTSTNIWEKPDCKTSIRYEHIIVWSRDFRRQPFKVWSVPILDYRTLKDWQPSHPTQKPVRLLRYLVQDYTQEGDLVMDPFAGTGTTGVAAQQLKRRYLLIERNTEYASFATRRLERPKTDEGQKTVEAPKEEPPTPNDDETTQTPRSMKKRS